MKLWVVWPLNRFRSFSCPIGSFTTPTEFSASLLTTKPSWKPWLPHWDMSSCSQVGVRKRYLFEAKTATLLRNRRETRLRMEWLGVSWAEGAGGFKVGSRVQKRLPEYMQSDKVGTLKAAQRDLPAQLWGQRDDALWKLSEEIVQCELASQSREWVVTMMAIVHSGAALQLVKQTTDTPLWNCRLNRPSEAAKRFTTC